MKLPEIVGISGTNGAGKDTLGELLVERSGYKFVSVSDVLRDELTKQGIPHEREHLRELSTSWARKFGHGVLAVKTIEEYIENDRGLGYGGLAIGSIRRPAEAAAVQRQSSGAVVWVDAERRVRYERIQAGNRGRADTDALQYEEWAAQEDIELSPIAGEPGSINMHGVRDIADVHIDNHFTSTAAYREFLINEFCL